MTKREMRKQIADLTERLVKLENMHAEIEKVDDSPWRFTPAARREFIWSGMEGSYCGRQLTARELSDRYGHPQPVQVDYSRITNVPKNTVNTNRISKITLEELARFVLDGTPIERKSREEVVYQTSYSPNETSEFVETKLGNISVIERND
jgi:hypothetical protein